ncbi:DUF5703 domain-containing protein [Geofilum sp. OHC36d9]|uniref:DUF5703 domain-containing protein n=1 Tax=Geofilum sp. OHC36d9 TaxID=3458413 RepID=UPI0040345A9B
MKVLIFIFLVVIVGLAGCKNDEVFYTDQYNVVWHEQSKGSLESMPVNGHSIGCNVWVEDGDLLFYAAQSGAFDENNESLKLGRFRIRLDPNPLADSCRFVQELKLHDGYAHIQSDHPKYGKVDIRFWVEAERPVVHVDLSSTVETQMKVSYESWRYEDVPLPARKIGGVKSRRASLFDFDCYLVDMVKFGDVMEVEENGLWFYHNNGENKSAFDFVVDQQHLESVKNKLDNPLQNLVSGGWMTGDELNFQGVSNGTYAETKFVSWNFESSKASEKHTLDVFAMVQQSNVKKWKKDVEEMAYSGVARSELFRNTVKWWNRFWDRSYVVVNKGKGEDDKPWILGRNYNLFRYQLGGNTYGRMPTKFNGGNLTVDPGFISNDFLYDPDFRRWGGGSFTAQNQRLVYWPMLKSGDFETILPQFEFYRKALNNALLRTHVYWGHGGCCFTEQMQQSGLPIASHYGFVKNGYWIMNRSENLEPGLQSNPFVQTLYQNQLEFAFMILQYYEYSGNDISAYIPFVYNCVKFYNEHYQYRNIQRTGQPYDKNDKLVLYPTTPGENSPNSTNASDAVAGFTAVVKAALNLPASVLPDSLRAYIEAVKPHIPDLELYTHTVDSNNYTLFRESKEDSLWHSGFMPSLYVLFPYHLVNFKMPEFEYAMNVWKYKMSESNKSNYASWRPGVFMGAELQLVDYCKEQLLRKLGDSGRRYPTFWGPGHDWVPDHNWGGSGMIGMQEMLLQEIEGKIYLFPAWPSVWDVKFKLYASKNTVVEAELVRGQVVNLKVTPAGRMGDVVVNL